MDMNKRLEMYTSVVPNRRQMIIQDMKFYAFIHYTVNTFTQKEWGSGTESPSVFNPKKQNTDQWCEAVKAAELKGIILTCKHHDGFCLWDTKTTEHNVMNSPYGRDVVRELSESCKKYGLKFGVYLSPWDRHCPLYGQGDAYNDYYIEQLTELLTNYGDIFCLWMDGACGSSKDGKPKQVYDFDRIWETAISLQPDIVLNDIGPDVRWIGNESGVTRESEWNVVPAFDIVSQNIANTMQQTDNMKKFQKNCVGVMIKDLGSRSVLEKYDSFMWYPAEADVSIRLGWFHHGIFDFTTKSLKKLMKIYYSTVGNNALMLLNIPPAKSGLLDRRDVKRLRQMGECIRKENSLVIKNSKMSDVKHTQNGWAFDITFDKQSVDRVRLEEDTSKSQRIEEFEIYAGTDDGEKLIYSGTIIGFGKIAIFKPVTTDRLHIVITKCRLEPYIKTALAVKTGAYTP